ARRAIAVVRRHHRVRGADRHRDQDLDPARGPHPPAPSPGMDLESAIRKAGEVRFLPLVPTILPAIGSLLPTALHARALYPPLAWVIIGGLVSSTLLARIGTPVMYRLIAPALEPAAGEPPTTEPLPAGAAA